MVALGFLEKAETGYANQPVAQSFLAGDPEEGLRPFLTSGIKSAIPRG